MSHQEEGEHELSEYGSQEEASEEEMAKPKKSTKKELDLYGSEEDDASMDDYDSEDLEKAVFSKKPKA